MRKTGIIFPLQSLPSREGMGTFGRSTIGFLDFLTDAGIKVWQLLPLGSLDSYGSPYLPRCSMAMDPGLLDVEELMEEGYLKDSWDWSGDRRTIDAGGVEEKVRFLKDRLVYTIPQEEFIQFLKREEKWIYSFLSYSSGDLEAIKGPGDLWKREEALMEGVLQFHLDRQWRKIKVAAEERGILLYGDLPFSCDKNSWEVARYPASFYMDGKNPRYVIGSKPDSFSEEGQYWGSPGYIFSSESGKEELWRLRFGKMKQVFHGFRVDHFRGYEGYWKIPEGHLPQDGCWEGGPGTGFFRDLEEDLGPLPILAEDLGVLTPDFHRFFKETGYPGMNVLQFAFDEQNSRYLPHNYIKNSVAVTGTHDNPPLGLWWEDLDEVSKRRAKGYLGLNSEEGVVEGLLRGVFASASELALFQLGDVLPLEGTFRINTPGTVGENWRHRLLGEYLTEDLAGKLMEMTRRYGR